EYRLPKKILDTEIEWIIDIGIEVKLNAEIGKNIKVQELLNGRYDAVYLAIGAAASRRLGIKDEYETEGVVKGIVFLRDIQLRGLPTLKGKVIVVGGGNTAIDAARSAGRLGAENVKVVYRRSINEMPAHYSEIEAAKEEGVEFIFLTNPKSILTSGNRIRGIECLKMRLEKAQANERPRPVPIPDSEYLLSCDYLIIAIGQEVEESFFHNLPECQRERWGTIKVDDNTLETSLKGVFAGGDAVTGPSTAVSAIASQKR
ncbi:unnamed protein product, partial [marine sediment metagenome]